MGNLCSFPLLCLQNYIAARWVDRLVGEGETPLLINGDDLVAQVSKKWLNTYKREAPRLGFELNEKKTMFSSSCLTVNSDYFTSKFRRVPFVRAKGLLARDPRVVGSVMNDILGPFLSVRHTRYGRLLRKLCFWFQGRIRMSGLTLWSLGLRVREGYQHFIPRNLRKREKERSGHPCRPPSLDEAPMRPQLELFSELDLVSDAEVSEAMVEAHWEGGKFIRPEKKRFVEVKKELREKRMRRCRGVGMRESLSRLVLAPKAKAESVWLPTKLADCYNLVHDRVRLDGMFVVPESCAICERVERWRQKRATEECDKACFEEVRQVVRDWGPYKVADVARVL